MGIETPFGGHKTSGVGREKGIAGNCPRVLGRCRRIVLTSWAPARTAPGGRPRRTHPVRPGTRASVPGRPDPEDTLSGCPRDRLAVRRPARPTPSRRRCLPPP
ncbi:hypothetical protein [Streptomyces sp. NPDC056660]|uniref:hypothetical protein n=1 Tax=Streptomyces sp. NPDC056660 TaxID=3345897 RepID=UPI0036AEF3E3